MAKLDVVKELKKLGADPALSPAERIRALGKAGDLERQDRRMAVKRLGKKEIAAEDAKTRGKPLRLRPSGAAPEVLRPYRDGCWSMEGIAGQ